MKLSCAQEALAEALGTVGRVVPGKATLPILTNVLLEADATGALRLTATNLELTVSRRIRGAVQSEGRTTVPARLLAEYVGLLDRGKQVSIQLNPSASKLHLACERFEANIATLPAEDFPPPPTISAAGQLDIDGAALKTAIEQVVFAAAADESRPVLAGVLVRLDSGQLILAAADGFRLAVSTVLLPDTTTRASWIVPARTLVEVAHSLPSAPGLPVILSGTATDNHLHVALGDVEVTSRLIEGQFPDYERIVPKDCSTSVIVGTAEFLRATRVATVFARDNSNIVRLECTAPPENGAPALGQLLVTATSAELGDNTGTLDASVQGSGGAIAFNCRYLRDALEVLAMPQVSFQFSSAHQPGVLRPVGDGDDAHMHVVMPLATPTR